METMTLNDSEWSLIEQALREKAEADERLASSVSGPGGTPHPLQQHFKAQAINIRSLAARIADTVGV